ncbi:acyltransferase family protein [Aeromonas caviae]|uniref:acyltransferase family protein n=1 Tax=Aeromonas caviae TaxID=648 RepID=UPI0019202394|nr:acyltransferase family protein [Aeromonas caviae]MBL0553789.1 acyltransferase family protein [Aeromonas caviae]
MRISSIECGRVVAILAVMTIHLSPFSNPFDPALWDGTPYPLVGAVINQLCRFAVPLFFLCAGYFLQPALAAGHPLTVALRYCRPLLGLWLAWSLLYVLIPFNPLAAVSEGYLPAMAGQWQMQLGDHLNVWWVGGMIHLWFLPALMVAVLILGLCQQVRLPRLALLLGALLYALEAAGLLRVAAVPLARHDFLLGSLPWALGLFGLLLANPAWGKGSWLERQAPKVLGLYCLHMMLVVWLMIFGPQGKQVWWELLKVPALLALTLLGYRLLAATALSRWLLRAR